MAKTAGRASIKELIREGAGTLSKSSDSPRLDAEVLLAFAKGVEREKILLTPTIDISPDEVERFIGLIERRKNFEPISYMTGKRDFYKSVFEVDRSVLIPRPETEELVELVLKKFDKESIELLDVGTGSGCIALSLALERPEWKITATDISAEALEVTYRNAVSLGAENVKLLEADIFDGLDGAFFDVIISNPPYISLKEKKSLPVDVKGFEPHHALFAENDGLAVLEKLLAGAPARLKKGGMLFCEIGFDQKGRIESVVDSAIWKRVSFKNDMRGMPRMLIAELK